MLAADPIQVVEASSVSEALASVSRAPFDAACVAARLQEDPTDRSGLEVVKAIRAASRETGVIVVGASLELADVRSAMRAGARDYVLRDELSRDVLLATFGSLPRWVPGERPRAEPRLIGSSPAMQRVRRVIERVADCDATVLVRGETGVGKELVARALHARSARKREPFVAVNCSALPGTLVESLLFGHERGAFTGADRRVRGQMELAGAGTILLDEIAEMAPELQSKLLRILEDKRFRPLGAEVELPLRARVVAATHADLEALVVSGRFREDLFYRLNVVSIDVPSIAERLDDLADLLAALSAELPVPLRFTADSVEWLSRRAWPGNVRELKNLVARIALLGDDEVVDAVILEALAADRRALDSVGEVDRLARALLALPDRLGSKLRVMERAVLHHAVEACGGNKAAAARLIGMDRKSLERRIDSSAADPRSRSRAVGGGGPASSRTPLPPGRPDDDE